MDAASGTITKWKPYPKYEDTGIEWLKEIPEHWRISRIKWISTKIGSGKTPRGGAERYASSGILFLRSQNIHFNGLHLDDAAFIDEITDNEMASTRVIPGDVLLNITGASLGRCTLAPISICPANVSQHVCIIRPIREELQSSFLNRYLSSIPAQTQIFLSEDGISREGLNFKQVGDIVIPAIAVYEQRAIAAFLDRETAKIDALIAKKERLIELLQEKRTALISHAVTKGLDPSVPMKDSGIDWLGEVPDHWKVLSLKHIVRTPITDGPHETPEFLNSGVPFVSAEAIWDGRVHLESIRGFISEESHKFYAKKYLPRRGDIFIVKSGSTTGRVAIVDFDDKFNIWSPLAAVRCKEEVAMSRFIFYALSSEYFQGLVQVSWSFGTQPNIGMVILGNLQVIVPNNDEQQAISAFLDRETTKTDTLSLKIQNSIEKLKEYRGSLISAAVTGKIDVRDEVGGIA